MISFATIPSMRTLPAGHAPGTRCWRSSTRAIVPEVQEVIAGCEAWWTNSPDRLLIGEIYLPIERLVTYYGRDLGGTHLPFNLRCSIRRGEAARHRRTHSRL